jgi:hypothetical protein
VTAPAAPPGSGTVPALDDATLTDIATRLWRGLRHAERLDPPSRPLARELTAALDALERAGVVVQDHDASYFDPGLALIAVAYEPTPGIDREQVLETLRPSVYLHGHHVQRGEVVVAVPVPDLRPPAEPTPTEIEETTK